MSACSAQGNLQRPHARRLDVGALHGTVGSRSCRTRAEADLYQKHGSLNLFHHKMIHLVFFLLEDTTEHLLVLVSFSLEACVALSHKLLDLSSEDVRNTKRSATADSLQHLPASRVEDPKEPEDCPPPEMRRRQKKWTTT